MTDNSHSLSQHYLKIMKDIFGLGFHPIQVLNPVMHNTDVSSQAANFLPSNRTQQTTSLFRMPVAFIHLQKLRWNFLQSMFL